MKLIRYALWAALELAYGWLCFRAFFAVKMPKHKAAWLMAAAWLVLAAGDLAAVPVLPVLVRLLVMVLVLTCVFGESGQKGLLVLAGSFALWLVMENSAWYLVSTFAEPEKAYTVTETAAKALLVLSAAAAVRFQTEKNRKWLFPAALLPTGLTFAGAAVAAVGSSWLGAALVCGVLILAVGAVLYAARAARKAAAQETDMMLQRQHIQMQTESINALEQNYRQQRKTAHEFERHIQVLDDLLEVGALEEARQYIRRLRTSRSGRVISVNSRNTVIDVILNQKYRTALENGIRMQIRVNDLSGVALPTDSLVVILSNLLDNATEACRSLDGYREIDCSVLYDGGLYIAVANTSRAVRIVDGSIGTTKPDALNHGYGLSNVCQLLDTLEAEYTFDYADGWFRFVAEIPE